MSLQRLRRTFEGRTREMDVRADRDKAEIYEGMITLTREMQRLEGQIQDLKRSLLERVRTTE